MQENCAATMQPEGTANLSFRKQPNPPIWQPLQPDPWREQWNPFHIGKTNCKIAGKVKDKIRLTSPNNTMFPTTLWQRACHHAHLQNATEITAALNWSITTIILQRANGHVNLKRLKEIADNNMGICLEILLTIPDQSVTMTTCDHRSAQRAAQT